MALRNDITAFRDSQEAAFRRFVRGAVRRADLTKGERDVTLALLNFWLHHKGTGKPIHPGREKLAKRAGVSVRTVASSLAMLRAAGVLEVVSNLKGGFKTATKYSVNLRSLMHLCGCDWADEFTRHAPTNCTVDKSGIARLSSAKIAHGIYSVQHGLCQNSSEVSSDE